MRKILLYIGLGGALLFGPQGCETGRYEKPHGQSGEAYRVSSGSFRGRWWSYYERGIQFAEGRRWREAEADLREAIRKQEGDQRRAKTYGMHFIDYFPHRELGVVLFHQERAEEAARELEISLRAEKSAKAEYYLDSARRLILKKDKQDTAPPRIEIHTPDDGALTNRLSCRVTGIVRDDTFVRSIKIGGLPVRLDLAAKEVPFAMDVALNAGGNTIRIEAEDLTGKTSVAVRTVRVDRQGPTISIDAAPADGLPGGKPIRLRGYVTDDSGIRQLRINGRDPGYPLGREVRLDSPIPPSSDSHSLLIEATDLAGNTTSALIAQPAQVSSAPRIYLASLDSFQLALLDGPKPRKDFTRPVIEFKGWTGEQTVYMDEVYLEGSARDDGRIGSLTVNGYSILKRPASLVYFSHLARLSEGANTFSVEAEDEAGNREIRELTLHYKPPKVRQIGSRLRLALMPLDRKEQPDLGLEPVEENILAGLMGRKRFDLVERRHLDTILKELNLSRSSLSSPDSGIRVGKIASANGVLLGSIVRRENSLEIYVHLVDVETSLIIAAVDVYGENVKSPGVRELCQGLVLKLCDEVPLVEGMILQVNGGQASTSLGRQTRVKKGMRLIIFEEGDPIRDPFTGTVLGANVEQLAHGVIQSVEESVSHAEVLEKEALGRIKPAQKVITQ